MKMLPPLLSCAYFRPLEPVVHLRRRLFLCPFVPLGRKGQCNEEKESSKIRKSGFNPNRACSLTADGKYYCYEFEDIETGQTVTQNLRSVKICRKNGQFFLMKLITTWI